MPEACAKCLELEKLVIDMNVRLDIVEHRSARMTEAFLQNELHLPDYDGHRSAHRKMTDEEKIIAGYKTDATKKVVGWGVAGAIGLFASGAVEHLKHLLKIGVP